ncbi:MAG: pyruvate dehydrogenase complex dihydrolipoamide acetyltransferase [Anaerolineales bacterium]
MAETIAMPKLGFDMAEGTLVRWVVGEGDPINKGDVLAEIETDKATVEVESSATGVLLKHLVDEGAIVPVSTPIAVVGEEGEEVSLEAASDDGQQAEPAGETPAPPTQPEPAPVSQSASSSDDERIKASPLARRMAEDKKVDLGNIVGTGPGGRIVRRDIEAALAGGQPSAASSQPRPVAQRPPSGEDEVIKLTKLRQAIGRRLVEAKQAVPHFYVTHEFKMDALLEARQRINVQLKDSGVKLSVNDFLVKAVALALREFPNLNASLDGDSVVRHGEINVGNAVAVEGGLLTVVCRNADRKSLREISAEVREMATAVREGKVRPEFIEGSTFSISNLGMYDVEHFIAIINPPEAAILAVGSALEVPVVENGEIKPGWRMKATISVDHRISDGAEVAQFMQVLAKHIEEPVLLAV